MSRYHDDNTIASNPGGVGLSKSKIGKFRHDLPFFKKLFSNIHFPFAMLDEHLRLGDSRAAVVLCVQEELLVAAYTDELDCVVLLKFPISFVNENQLEVGSRLLTVNTYSAGKIIARDLENGPLSYKRYNNFYPLIADFLSDSVREINERKSDIDENEWKRTETMGRKKLGMPNLVPRNGSPYSSAIPGR